MCEGVVKVLGNRDIEFANILHRLGVQRNVAKVITFLAVVGEATSKEIELGFGLKHPDISIAMRTLRR